MHYRTLLGSVGGIIIVLTGTYFVLNYESVEPVEEAAVLPQTLPASSASAETEAVTEATKGEDTTAVVPTEVPETPEIPTPIIPKKSGYTRAEVSVHADESSCWSIIDGNVYDLTSFIGMHPGGERNILKICGRDGTNMFMGMHGGDTKPESALANFLLGAYSG